MGKYVYTVMGSTHKFKTKQEALDYASFDRWIEGMNGAPPSMTIISRHTPEQYKRWLKHRELLMKEVQS